MLLLITEADSFDTIKNISVMIFTMGQTFTLCMSYPEMIKMSSPPAFS